MGLFEQLYQEALNIPRYLSPQPQGRQPVPVPTGVPTGMPGLVEQLPSMEQWKQLLQTDIQPPAPVPVVPTQVGQPPVGQGPPPQPGPSEIRLPAEPQSTTPLPPGLPPEFVAAVQARDAEAQRGYQREAGNPWLNGQQPTGPAPPGVQGQQSPGDLAAMIEQAKRLKEPAPVMMPAGAGESVDQARETGRRIRVKLGLDGQGPTPNATLQDPGAIAALRDKYGLQEAGTLRNTNRKLGLEAFQNTKNKLTPEGQQRLEDNSAAKADAIVPIKVRRQARTRRAQGLDPSVDQLSAIERGDEGAQQALADADLVRKFGPAGVDMVEARKAGEAQRLAADVEREKIASQEKIATGKIKAEEEAATAGIPTWQVSNPETTRLVSPEGLKAFQDVVNANPAQLDQLEQLRQTHPGKWVDEAFRLAESAGLSPQEVVAVVSDWAGGSDALGGMLVGQNTLFDQNSSLPFADKYLPGWNKPTFPGAGVDLDNPLSNWDKATGLGALRPIWNTITGQGNLLESDANTRGRVSGIANKSRKRVVVKPAK